MENNQKSSFEKAAECFEKGYIIEGASYLFKAYYEQGKSKEILGYFDQIFFKPNLEEMKKIYNLNLGKINKELKINILTFENLPFYVIPICENYFYIYDKTSNDIIIEDFTKEQITIIEFCTNENLEIKNEADTKKYVDILLKNKKDSFSLISVIVLAYNNLEYTKLCIDSIYKNLKEFEFELITVNNGSTDGTKEYFESLPSHKCLNFEKNMGISKGFNAALEQVEGEYILYVSNDIILTNNSVKNLFNIITIDSNFGMIVPSCNFTSNYQLVNLEYQNILEMNIESEKYNSKNPTLYHEKIRLIPYVFLTRTNLIKEIGGFGEEYGYGGFDDDDISFRIRRHGYKLIFAKGTFVHHFGSKTVSKVISNHMLQENRLKFLNKFGVDSWEVAEVDWSIINNIEYSNIENKNIKVLGIDCLAGADLLEIKNKYYENNRNAELHALTKHEKYISDLKSISSANIYNNISIDTKLYDDNTFQLIMLKSKIHKYKELMKSIDSLVRILEYKGQLIFSLDSDFFRRYKIDSSHLLIEMKEKFDFAIDINLISESNKESNKRYIYKVIKRNVMNDGINLRQLELKDLNNIACISFYGRSGSVFLQSLLDSHENILMLPGLYLMDYGVFWHSISDIDNKESLVSRFCDKYDYIFETKKRYPASKEEPWNDLPYYCRYDEMGDSQDQYINIDKDIFIVELYRCINSINNITRKDFFKAIQIAYFYASGRTYTSTNDPLIIYPLHTSLVSKTMHMWVLEDFSDAKILYTVREPISNLGSSINYQIYFDLFKPNSPNFLFYSLGILTGPLSLYGTFNMDNIKVVRLEDLHLESRNTLECLCRFLNIEWSDSLLESTFNGLKWWNFRDTSKVNGFNKNIISRNYDELFTNFDKFRIETLLKDIYESWGYGKSYFNDDKKLLELLEYPFKFEEKIQYSNLNEKNISMIDFRKLLYNFYENREELSKFIRSMTVLNQ